MTRSDDEIRRRILAQRVERYHYNGPDLSPYGSARYLLEPRRLRVAAAQIEPRWADEVVELVIQFARGRMLSVQWSVIPALAGERELPRALTARGFYVFEDMTLMAHRGPIVAPTPAPDDVTIHPIATWQTMLDYELGSRISFFDDPHPAMTLVRQRADERWRECQQGWRRYYYAAINGRLVGGCYVSLYEDIPTLMGVYSLPEARRRGVATALLKRAVAETITPQNDVTSLYVQRGNPAELLYRSLRFTPLFSTQTYALDRP